MKTRRLQAGFSLLETIMFVGIASLVIVIVVNLFIIYGKVYETSQAIKRINVSATTAFERVTREVKSADSVNTGLSTFGAHPGVLVLNTTESETPVVIEFYVDGATLMMKKDSVVVGALTGEDVEVDRFVLSFLSNSTSELVKIDMNIRTQNGTTTKSASFLTSAVLRGSY